MSPLGLVGSIGLVDDGGGAGFVAGGGRLGLTTGGCGDGVGSVRIGAVDVGDGMSCIGLHAAIANNQTSKIKLARCFILILLKMCLCYRVVCSRANRSSAVFTFAGLRWNAP
jgi:hypothetical protein